VSIWSFPRHKRTSGVNRRTDRGPFDVIGDVHGCAAELDDLFLMLGYAKEDGGWVPPDGRTAVFVGDLVDRGPDNAGVLRRVMAMAGRKRALAVPGNHDLQLQRFLEGREVSLSHGLAETVAELEREPSAFRDEVLTFLQGLPSHYVFDAGALVVAHTGLPEALHGRESARIRPLAAYGTSSGEVDPGDPDKRHSWVAGYRGAARVVYGHTPVLEPAWRRQTIDIDTGCVYGVRLTALRWPELTLASVRARRAYAAPTRHFPPGRKRTG
jgi:diadenosine tetraphosphatase ApaH/serine/threonine PP2A family protein phosphatase